ncbi:MAG TPA: hypothetical protein VMH22_07220 [bacterium]|nr:hypothetical protein [bacterium]
MKNESKDPDDIDFTDAELDLFGDFTDAVQRRENPDIEEYLARCPESRDKMRTILEMALLLDREMNRFRGKYPHVDLKRLNELRRESRQK